MKILLLSVGLMAATAALPAQQHVPPSPPEESSATLAGKIVAIDYSSPRVRGREGKIFSNDGLISHDPHYPVWRAGANSATTLHTKANLTLGSLTVPAGNYTLFVDIADPNGWILVVSKQTGEWGLSYDPSQDLGRVKMTMSKPAHMVEALTWKLASAGANAATLSLAWEDRGASISIEAR